MLTNRRARFDYDLLDEYEAGLRLTGSEVKSLRQGGGSIAEAYVRVANGEAWLENMTIPPYKDASYNNHEQKRPRKLLLKKREIAELRRAVERGGLTCVPTRLYFKDGWAKVTVRIARGRKKHDKRRAEAEKDARKQIDRYVGN